MRTIELLLKDIVFGSLRETFDAEGTFKTLKKAETEEYRKFFKERYNTDLWRDDPYRFVQEFIRYGTILEGTPLVCIYGEDGSLNYNYQCQKCGNLILTNHGDEDSITYDPLCMKCNNLPLEKSPFKQVKRGTLEWIIRMRNSCIMRDDSGYIVNDYNQCRFGYKWYHSIALFFVQRMDAREFIKREWWRIGW